MTDFYMPSIANFTNIYPVGAELTHADRQMDRYSKANRCFSWLCGHS